ncbi:MAG: hypothetical protein R3E87_19140 [Burkholderiaceae bacterium]
MIPRDVLSLLNAEMALNRNAEVALDAGSMTLLDEAAARFAAHDGRGPGPLSALCQRG